MMSGSLSAAGERNDFFLLSTDFVTHKKGCIAVERCGRFAFQVPLQSLSQVSFHHRSNSNVTQSERISIRYLKPESLLSSVTPSEPPAPVVDDKAPPGFVKSILPCTPLAIVKCLEYTRVYNTLLPYGDRAYGKTITVINR